MTTPPGELSRWLLASRSRALDISPDGDPPDLTNSTLGSDIVGIATGLRSGHESLLGAHMVLRALVAAGFRAVALEGTTDTSADLHRWITHGHGDPRALLLASQAFLHNVETLSLLRSLRAHNESHPDDQITLVHADPASRRDRSTRWTRSRPIWH